MDEVLTLLLRGVRVINKEKLS